jgi:signal peptidase I
MEQFFTESMPDSNPDQEEGKPFQFKRFLIELVQTLLISALLYLAIDAISARIQVLSISMQPTLYEKDFVLVNKVVYKLDAPERGDVIVFRYPPNPETTPYIKRVIGIPGDTVRITDREVFVNDQPITEPYIAALPDYKGEWSVGENELFVLGDNRNNSSDSHHWGMVPLENVIGKAEFIYWPVGHWRVLHMQAAVAASP